MPKTITTSFVTEPSTMKDVAVTSRCSHNPLYEMAPPMTHDKTTARPVPLCHAHGGRAHLQVS